MKSSDDLSWLSKTGFLWEAVRKDAQQMGYSPKEYIKQFQTEMESYCTSSRINGREDSYVFLRQLYNDFGQFL